MHLHIAQSALLLQGVTPSSLQARPAVCLVTVYLRACVVSRYVSFGWDVLCMN